MKPPQLTIAHDPSSTHYGFAGWEDFNQYARQNWPLWASLHDSVSYMNEGDRFRMMLAMYATHYEALKKEYSEYVRDNPAPVMGPNGEVWRYKGP